ncbi:MAG: permease-like cell division protein FtsX [Saprospiraceae bacterium]
MAARRKSRVPGNKPNYFYSILGITLVLVLVGVFGLLMMHANGLFHWFKEKVEIIVEIRNDVSRDSISVLETQLKSDPYAKAGSLSFISKEEGAEMMRKEFGEDF